jgi:hypothetical protein
LECKALLLQQTTLFALLLLHDPVQTRSVSLFELILDYHHESHVTQSMIHSFPVHQTVSRYTKCTVHILPGTTFSSRLTRKNNIGTLIRVLVFVGQPQPQLQDHHHRICFFRSEHLRMYLTISKLLFCPYSRLYLAQHVVVAVVKESDHKITEKLHQISRSFRGKTFFRSKSTPPDSRFPPYCPALSCSIDSSPAL